MKIKRWRLYSEAGSLLTIVTASTPAIAIGADPRAVMALWAPR